ncbi:YhaN family protein [Paucibacter sp. Y2R2-4]|uniref:YhaN family protein n=1 Tax=Paucibacter sp. Y2R2-4 TaxID=2893553 RepID=UPI0021E45786|nr:YhaN family protein [Paucibacter sp. Y2R2-4]MCV2350209.1 AAA family ATPase [Paucibacter sp. Y2R2-4]
MRFQHLDLSRYGKFTDQRLVFPQAKRDFHLIVGANEAGKSTTRQAILDLLFGIENRSNYDFLHAKAEMRLGGRIELGEQSLDFVRTKARTKSLLDAQGQVLPESALAAFLASSDRAFFEQMFGLDHGRLEAGGQAILSAQNDIGQILFQSAAGIGSLGAVRESLEAEADKLWAKRRSGDRAYYQASDELAAAEAALKAATVRTKDWMDARQRSESLQQRREALRQQLQVLDLQRSALERVRRVAPALRQLDHGQQALEELQTLSGLSPALQLPEDAGRVLAELELELAAAASSRQLLTAQAERAQSRLDALHVDHRLLQQQSAIEALQQLAFQVRHHGRDIERCQSEIKVYGSQLQADARYLGWRASDEQSLSEQLPSLPERAAFAVLAKRYELLDQTCRLSEAALAEKGLELAALQLQLKSLAVQAPSAQLQAGLARARALGDVQQTQRREQAQLLRLQADLDIARRGLGAQALSDVALAELALPSEAAMQQRLQRVAELKSRCSALEERLAALRAERASAELALSQYRQAHQPVSSEDVAQQRAERDAAWLRIRDGALNLLEAAPAFESAVQAADGVADRRYAKAREASELQAKLDAQARLSLMIDETAANLSTQQAELLAQQQDWAASAERLGLAGLDLLDVEAWRLARERVLAARAALLLAQQEALANEQQTQAACKELRVALQALAGGPLEASADAALDLASLVLQAGAAVEAATAAQVQAQSLQRQIELASQTQAGLREKCAVAGQQMQAWQNAWTQACQRLRLASGLDPALADEVCAAMARVEAGLRAVLELRQHKIQVMQTEWADFERDLARCGAVLGQAAPEGEAAEAWIRQLSLDLSAARAAAQEAQRLEQSVQDLQAQLAATALQCAKAEARLQPLLKLAGLDDASELPAVIEASEARRRLNAQVMAARQALQEGGDGLSVEALQTEMAAVDLVQLPVQMADLGRQIAEAQQQGDALMAELTQADAALAQIAGQDDAARAEGQRQDALAKMANAAERYVKVYTAARLLKWAIDRYRETKQGPMLSRAGEIFAALTRGSFQRLALDFDVTPLSLQGLRADGRLVAIGGMSEGTRDQLFMALRLAALELHLGQDASHALPFIADDLFINYDDARAEAGLRALADLSERTQVIFLSHHQHLEGLVRQAVGAEVNIIRL